MNISIYNKQKDLLFSKKKIILQVEAILESQNIKIDEIDLHFVDTKTIIHLHEKYFNDPTPTDCISFPVDELSSDEHPIVLGDVFVCPKTAIDYAVQHDTNPYEELSLYIIHGILHLIGYDDQTPEDREKMQKKEKECMKYLKSKKLLVTKNRGKSCSTF